MVPGCLAGGSGDQATHDYCYDPYYRRSTRSLIDIVEKKPLIDSGNVCGVSHLCTECEGDCDKDSDCAFGLKCYQRQSSDDMVPGCLAGGSGDQATHDYCYDPYFGGD